MGIVFLFLLLVSFFCNQDCQVGSYLEMRRKNNAAVKKSRFELWLMMMVQMRKISNAVFVLIFAIGGSPASGGRSNENRHAEISSGARRS